MNDSTMNINLTEASANCTTNLLLDNLEICTCIINLFFALPTHCYVIWLIVTGTGSGVASEFFILNLSVCEIGICLNSISDVFIVNWFESSILLTWFLLGLGTTGHPLFQCLMCVERYLAVVHPVTFLKYKPLRYRVICCSAAWMITIGSCLCSMLILALFNFYTFVYINSFQYLVFVSVQLFCCLAVLRALKQSGPGERGRDREEENHTKRRAFYIILLNAVSMAVIYWPFTITGFFFILTEQNMGQSFSVCYIVFILAGFVQPVLYLHSAGKTPVFVSHKFC